MITIRLTRVGKKKAPVYRVVVQPKTRDPWAKTTAILGHYNPRSKELVVKQEETATWIKNGAECSDSVWNLFVEHKLVSGEKRTKSHLTKKRKGKMEKAIADKKAKEEAEKAKAEAARQAELEAKKAAEEAAKAAAEAPTEAAPEAAAEEPAATE